MASIDDIIDKARPQEVSCTLPVRGDLLGRLRDLSERLDEAVRYDEGHNEPDTAPEVRAELDQLRADYEADAVVFTFRGLPRREWHALLAKCPPSDEDRASGYDYDPETFPLEAMAASCIAPDDVTVDQVTRLAEVMSNGPFTRLWETCLAANVGVEDEAIPFTAAVSGDLLSFVRTSTSAAPEGSPPVSSPGE